MATPPPAEVFDGDVLETAYQHVGPQGFPCVCVRHWICLSVGPDGCDPLEFLGDIVTDWWLAVRFLLSNQCSYHGVRWRSIVPDYSDDEDYPFGPVAGLSAGNCMPPQTAGCIQLICEGAPKRKMGRLYPPPCSVSRNDATGRPNSGYVSACLQLASSFGVSWGPYGPGSGCYFFPVVWSRTGGVFFLLDTVEVETHWRTVRRRGGYRVLPPT